MIKEDVSSLTYNMTHRTIFHIIIRVNIHNAFAAFNTYYHQINCSNLIKISKQYDTIDESLSLKFILLSNIYKFFREPLFVQFELSSKETMHSLSSLYNIKK